MNEYLKDKELNSVLEEYINSLVNEAEGINSLDAIKNRLSNSSMIQPDAKQNLLGKIIRANKQNKNAELVQQLIEQYQLSHTYNTKYGKLVYTSPDIKIKNNEVKIVSSASIYCRDGYASIKNAGSLESLISIYNFLSDNDESKIDKYIQTGCEQFYTNRNVTIDKNYKYIADNWLKIKNIYLYTLYSQSSVDSYCDIEVDISKFKGLQDYIPKKSCTLIYIRFNHNTGNIYIGTQVLTDRVKLFELVDPSEE